jgi:hypothetical protein
MVPIVASREGMIQSRTLPTQTSTPMVTTVSREHVRIYFNVTPYFERCYRLWSYKAC